MGGLFSKRNREERPPRTPPIVRPTPTPDASTFTSYRSQYGYDQYVHQYVHRQTPQPVARVVPSTTTSYPPQYGYDLSVHRQTPQAVTRVVPSTTTSYSSRVRSTAYEPITTPSPSRVLPTAVSRLPLVPAVYEEDAAWEWNLTILPHGESFHLVNMSEYEDDFVMVQQAFNDGAKRKNFQISKIERVVNPFLLGCYFLKKEEMSKRYGFVEEQVHFHGTKKSNVKRICENNFDWRLHGDSTGHRFGKGVSFSPISFYASHYSDKNDTDKVMFYVKVLVSCTVVGNGKMILPPKVNHYSNSRYDTTEKEGGSVAVKFSDNEFYPQFLIHYKTPQPNHRYQPQPRYVNYTSQPTDCYSFGDYYCEYYCDDC